MTEQEDEGEENERRGPRKQRWGGRREDMGTDEFTVWCEPCPLITTLRSNHRRMEPIVEQGEFIFRVNSYSP